MSCNSKGAKELSKMKNPGTSLDSEFGLDINKNKKSSSEVDIQIDNGATFLDKSEDSNQTLDLFKRYRPLVKPTFGNGERKNSFLERSLLPKFSRDLTPPSSASDKVVKAQLTIFYRGEINVYNDVTFEKAQAVMAFAGETSLSAPHITNSPKIDMIETAHNQQKISLLSKTQAADLPIARKFSLIRFLEKRRDRITSKAPYPSPERRHDEATSDNNDNNQKREISPLVLSPFPSRLGNSLFLSK